MSRCRCGSSPTPRGPHSGPISRRRWKLSASIDIFWADDQHATIDPSEEIVMIEVRGGYFETVRHAMVGLQHSALHE